MGSQALRILVVDDSETTRRLVGTILRSRHWTVCGEADNGRAGVEKFHTLKPDLVLLDLAMPDMDGIEAAKQMTAADPSVPLILHNTGGGRNWRSGPGGRDSYDNPQERSLEPNRNYRTHHPSAIRAARIGQTEPPHTGK
jgi:hypothetical protein